MQRIRTLHLFAGAGGGILADILLGHQPVCAVENNRYCQQIISQRQKDGYLPWFPIFGDVQEFDGRPWRGLVDVVSGGFPCQDISSAGRGAGISGERSGLWSHMARIIREIRPLGAFVENSPMLTVRGLGVVLGDLASMGYDAEWGVLGAADVGAQHKRDRMWIVAKYPDADMPQCKGGSISGRVRQEYADISDPCWWQTEPGMGRVADGLANRVDRLKAIGNGQVPKCASEAWLMLTNNMQQSH